jgi:AbrB family looped-hinge helix DNA binding protein
MRVTSKGQVTIPKHVRRATGIREGTEVDARADGRNVVLSKARRESGKKAANKEDFAAYLDRVTGIIDLGMTTDEFMQLLRGE